MNQEIVSYFQNVAETHIGIGHTSAKRRFFRMSIEELYIGSSSSMDASDKCVLILIDLKRKVSETPQSFQETEVFFFIMRSASATDMDKEAQSLAITEEVVDDILRKIRHDSNNNHPLFGRGMDKLSDVSISPEVLHQHSVKLVGQSCHFKFTKHFNTCYDPSKFGL